MSKNFGLAPKKPFMRPEIFNLGFITSPPPTPIDSTRKITNLPYKLVLQNALLTHKQLKA